MSKKEKEAGTLQPGEDQQGQFLEDQQIIIVNNMSPDLDSRDDYRTIVACGGIEEESAAQIIHSMLYYSHKSASASKEDAPSPIELLISTCGGSAIEMFGIYDVMREVREKVPLVTSGVGKVMSAGVLLLAAGTKGKRKIGRNCRVMIHGVMGGYHGSLSNMENEIEEVKWIQERYIENLVEESFLSKKKIKSMLKKHVDVYLSAEDAVKYGIADIVI